MTGDTLVSRIGYDSRSNQTLAIDPKGNTAATAYDGASRAIESIQHLREDGNGGPPPEGMTLLADGGATVRTVSVYDTNGRVVELIDDRGGSTLYTYDTLSRQTAMTFHDGSTRTTEYNAASDVTEYTDENGSVFAYTYDAIGRSTAVAVTGASNVIGTTAQSFEYDGLGRRTKAVDTSGSDADCLFAYDSLSRLVEEVQTFGGNTRYVTGSAFESLLITERTYPSTREVGYNYDELYRRDEIIDDPSGTPATIAQWAFYGAGRVAELNLGNGLICTQMNNARTNSAVQSDVANPAWGDKSTDRLGYDGAGRAITKRYLDATASASGYSSDEALAGFTTQYDHASNKLYERHIHAESRSHLYPSLDSLDRLLQYQRGTLQQAPDGTVSAATAITLPGTDSDRSYRLDGVGNWQRTTYTPVGSAETTQVRQHNHVNQVTKAGQTEIRYDGPSYARAILEMGPTAYWRLGETSGTMAADQTGNYYFGTYRSTPPGGYTLGQTGSLVDDPNTAVKFNGSTGYVRVPYYALQITGDLTVMAWVNMDTFPTSGNYAAIAGGGCDATDTAYWLAIHNDAGTLKLIAGAGPGQAPALVSWTIADWAVDQWVQVAARYDGTHWRLFFNGQQVAVAADTTAPMYLANPFHIATFEEDGTRKHYLNGTLDEVAVFATALSGAQIQQSYQIGMATLAGPAGNGNITLDGTRRYAYDALNRVKEVYEEDSLNPGEFTVKIADYTYDAMGRRIRKVISNEGLPGTLSNDTVDFLYDGVQCIEERDGSNTPIRQYVWGAYVDELIQQRDINGGDTDYYPLSDLLYRTVALTDDPAEGAVAFVEAYDCDAYGNTLIFTDAETPRDTWFTDADADYPTLDPLCQFIFTGRRYDPETSDADSQMYFYRARYYSPVLGRFISRDPRGYEDGMGLYEYVGSAPTRGRDPMGLAERNTGQYPSDPTTTIVTPDGSTLIFGGDNTLTGFLSCLQ